MKQLSSTRFPEKHHTTFGWPKPSSLSNPVLFRVSFCDRGTCPDPKRREVCIKHICKIFYKEMWHVIFSASYTVLWFSSKQQTCGDKTPFLIISNWCKISVIQKTGKSSYCFETIRNRRVNAAWIWQAYKHPVWMSHPHCTQKKGDYI